jgi:hypothetical protein
MVLIDIRREEMMKTVYIEVQGGRDLNGPYSSAQEIGLISAWICFFFFFNSSNAFCGHLLDVKTGLKKGIPNNMFITLQNKFNLKILIRFNI